MATMTTSGSDLHDFPHADSPTKFKWKDWKQIFIRVKQEIVNDRISAVAAANAYYILFALFPLMIAIVSIYGLFADPVEVENQVNAVASFVPSDASMLLREQLHGIVTNSEASLGFGAIISLFATLWAASAGTRFIMEAMNIAYDEEEKRGLVRFYAEALGITIGGVVFVALTVFLLGGVPAILNFVGLGHFTENLLLALRWPLFAVIVITSLSVLNRFAPSRTKPKWRWITPGAILSTALILLASAGLALYFEKFASYNKTYGSLAGVMILLFWLYVMSFAVLVGVELNSEIEHHTRADSTVGAEKPMGRRGAKMADSLPASPTKSTHTNAVPDQSPKS